jgi:hypothetical protein
MPYFENFDWLAGCETSNEIYCSPPLHFPNKHEACNKQGFCGANHLSSEQQRHSESQNHTHCYVQVKLFGKQQSFDLLIDDCRKTTSPGVMNK